MVEEPREAHPRAQLQRLRAHLLRERNSFVEVGLGQFAVSLFQSEFAAKPKRLWLGYDCAGIRPERFFDRLERARNGAAARLSLRQPCSESGVTYVRANL